jgi:hypothetical protein
MDHQSLPLPFLRKSAAELFPNDVAREKGSKALFTGGSAERRAAMLAGALPTSPQAQQPQQVMRNEVLAA